MPLFYRQKPFKRFLFCRNMKSFRFEKPVNFFTLLQKGENIQFTKLDKPPLFLLAKKVAKKAAPQTAAGLINHAPGLASFSRYKHSVLLMLMNVNCTSLLQRETFTTGSGKTVLVYTRQHHILWCFLLNYLTCILKHVDFLVNTINYSLKQTQILLQ